MKKNECLEMWENLTPNQKIMQHMQPIAYKAKGSTYGACGVRIDGTPQFVKAVLSHLQEMIQGENEDTRLTLSYNTVSGDNLGKSFDNKEDNAVCCYIRLHERGDSVRYFNKVKNALKQKNQCFNDDDLD